MCQLQNPSLLSERSSGFCVTFKPTFIPLKQLQHNRFRFDPVTILKAGKKKNLAFTRNRNENLTLLQACVFYE